MTQATDMYEWARNKARAEETARYEKTKAKYEALDKDNNFTRSDRGPRAWGGSQSSQEIKKAARKKAMSKFSVVKEGENDE